MEQIVHTEYILSEKDAMNQVEETTFPFMMNLLRDFPPAIPLYWFLRWLKRGKQWCCPEMGVMSSFFGYGMHLWSKRWIRLY